MAMFLKPEELWDGLEAPSGNEVAGDSERGRKSQADNVISDVCAEVTEVT